MSVEKATELVKNVITCLERYKEPPVIRAGEHPLKSALVNSRLVLAELLRPALKCTTCGGVNVVHSGEPTMYNCELGGDCSEDPNWTKEDCKACGKTVPCPECRPEANKYYHLWNKELRRANSLHTKLSEQPEPTEFTKMLHSVIEDLKHRPVSPVVQVLQRLSSEACDIIDGLTAENKGLKGDDANEMKPQ